MDKQYDILGIGSAVVDVISYRSNEFIKKHGLNKGSSAFLGEKEIQKLYEDMGASTECSGGCAANVVVGASMLGAKTAFIGKVNNDYAGRVFRKSLEKNGVFLGEPYHEALAQTARCMIIITEEVEPISGRTIVDRTMASYLGASNELEANDIDEQLIAGSNILFLEGFLWNFEGGYDAAHKAIELAKKHNVKIAISLSDPLCVLKYQDEFIENIRNNINILFCSRKEAEALLGTKEERATLYNFSQLCKESNVEIAALTCGAKGSYLFHEEEIHHIEAEPVKNIFDVTGAGDLYAAAILYGYIHNMAIEKSGHLASLCAAEVIRYLGARPATDIKNLLENL